MIEEQKGCEVNPSIFINKYNYLNLRTWRMSFVVKSNATERPPVPLIQSIIFCLWLSVKIWKKRLKNTIFALDFGCFLKLKGKRNDPFTYEITIVNRFKKFGRFKIRGGL